MSGVGGRLLSDLSDSDSDRDFGWFLKWLVTRVISDDKNGSDGKSKATKALIDDLFMYIKRNALNEREAKNQSSFFSSFCCY